MRTGEVESPNTTFSRWRVLITSSSLASHLRHVLASHQTCNNEVRTHLSLQKDTPVRRDVCSTGRVFVADLGRATPSMCSSLSFRQRATEQLGAKAQRYLAGRVLDPERSSTQAEGGISPAWHGHWSHSQRAIRPRFCMCGGVKSPWLFRELLNSLCQAARVVEAGWIECSTFAGRTILLDRLLGAV